jgi:hypothetical protein
MDVTTPMILVKRSEAMQDVGRGESLEAELDQLTEHLYKALGLGGKTSTVNTLVDRARSAGTWRIRSAIKKIKSIHPSLGKHLISFLVPAPANLESQKDLFKRRYKASAMTAIACSISAISA